MNNSIRLIFYITLSNIIVSIAVASVALIALSSGPYASKLYSELSNSAPPSVTDPTISDAQIRESVCKDIIESGFLYSFNFVSSDAARILLNRNPSEYRYVFRKFYASTDESESCEFTNTYKPLTFSLRATADRLHEEYLFVCPVWNLTDGVVDAFFVSKEYNVGPRDEPYMPGRFVFGNLLPGPSDTFGGVILAEKPGNVYTAVDFNVELHYLRMRRYIQAAESDDIDPLCRLLTGVASQAYRICVAVSRSSHFRGEVKYPDQAYFPCTEKEVSFGTTEGEQEASGKSAYFERMMLCHSVPVDSGARRSFLYISRAYLSNQVFVYRRYASDERIYLENICTNISIVDELNSFDFVEE